MVYSVIAGNTNAIDLPCLIVNTASAQVTCKIVLREPFGRYDNQTINFILENTTRADQVEHFLVDDRSIFRSVVFPGEIFSAFPNLIKLTMPADIRELKKTDFTNATNLIHFILTNAHTPTIPDLLFEKAKNLALIVLRNDAIQTIDDYAFYKYEKLEVLSLSENHIRNIKSKMFLKLPVLRALYLRNNKIKSIEDGSFDLPSLRQLSLNNNDLIVLSDKLFAATPQLRVFTVQSNSITNISNALYGLQELRKLDLSVNMIQDLDIVKLSKLPQLEHLSLEDSGFNISTVNISIADMETSNSKLKILDLSKNRITDSKIFGRLHLFKKLEAVNLANNDIGFCEFELRTPQLTTIKFDGNYIQRPSLNQVVMRNNLTYAQDEKYIVTSPKMEHVDFDKIKQKLSSDSVYFL